MAQAFWLNLRRRLQCGCARRYQGFVINVLVQRLLNVGHRARRAPYFLGFCVERLTLRETDARPSHLPYPSPNPQTALRQPYGDGRDAYELRSSAPRPIRLACPGEILGQARS